MWNSSEGDPLPEVGDGLQSTTAANLPDYVNV